MPTKEKKKKRTYHSTYFSNWLRWKFNGMPTHTEKPRCKHEMCISFSTCALRCPLSFSNMHGILLLQSLSTSSPLIIQFVCIPRPHSVHKFYVCSHSRCAVEFTRSIRNPAQDSPLMLTLISHDNQLNNIVHISTASAAARESRLPQGTVLSRRLVVPEINVLTQAPIPSLHTR